MTSHHIKQALCSGEWHLLRVGEGECSRYDSCGPGVPPVPCSNVTICFFEIAHFSPLVVGVHYHFIAAALSLLGGSGLCPEEGLVMEVNSRVAISGGIASEKGRGEKEKKEEGEDSLT